MNGPPSHSEDMRCHPGRVRPAPPRVQPGVEPSFDCKTNGPESENGGRRCRGPVRPCTARGAGRKLRLGLIVGHCVQPPRHLQLNCASIREKAANAWGPLLEVLNEELLVGHGPPAYSASKATTTQVTLS